MGTEDQSTPGKIEGKFGDDKKGGTTQPCPTSIAIHFVPLPPNHIPNNKPPGAGEQTFKDRYKFKLTGGDGKVLNEGVLNLRIGQIIRHDKADCGKCTLTIEFPKFDEAREIFWRKVWPSHYSVQKIELKELDTGKSHVFDIINEVWAVAVFMANEIKTNAASGDVRRMKSWNDAAAENERAAEELTAEAEKSPWLGPVKRLEAAAKRGLAATDRAAAMTLWTERVAPGRPWDHKPIFTQERRKIGETQPLAWHTWGEWEYYFDVWSNLHFGYVGRAAGFTRDDLLWGANAQQWLADKLSGRQNPGDPTQDRAAIVLGSDLFDNRTDITPEVLAKTIEDAHELDRRPHSYNSEDQSSPNKSIRKR